MKEVRRGEAEDDEKHDRDEQVQAHWGNETLSLSGKVRPREMAGPEEQQVQRSPYATVKLELIGQEIQYQSVKWHGDWMVFLTASGAVPTCQQGVAVEAVALCGRGRRAGRAHRLRLRSF